MKCISQEKYLHHLGTNVKTRTLLVYSEATNTINPNLIIKTHVYNVVVLHLFYTRYLQMMLYIQTQKHKENVKHKYNSNNIYHTSSTRLWVRRDFQSILPPNLDTASLKVDSMVDFESGPSLIFLTGSATKISEILVIRKPK